MCKIGSLVDFMDTDTKITKLNCLNLILINGPFLLQLKWYAMYIVHYSTYPLPLAATIQIKKKHLMYPYHRCTEYIRKVSLH